MAQSTRQRNLFAAEDFTVVYDSFKQANFQAYDFDTIRTAMVDYVQTNFPENFNDWIKSSEFVALIELIAFVSHNLAFRTDLATRENFLSTAERRESVLRLVDFMGYNPSRSIPASGLLKIQSVKTSQNVYDISGNSLKNLQIPFFEEGSPETFQNFLLVMNEIFTETNTFGRPQDQGFVNNVKTEVYQTNTADNQNVVFSFKGKVNGRDEQFEVHSTEIDDNQNIESIPDPDRNFSLLYRNDNQGLGSKNTGFFVGFKQGSLTYSDYDADSAISNLALDVGATNVNNNDVWVQGIDSLGTVLQNWTKVDSTFGTSAMFNNIQNNISSIYSVKTLENDNISINFGDGIFTEIPRGIIRTWYRSGINDSYTLEPDDVGTVTFSFDYVSKQGNNYTATFTATLEDSVNNASRRESLLSIKENAGRVFATQDRMITGEDYAVMPLTVSNNVRKIKSINRTHSGHSRFIRINDPTAQYQNVKMFSDDGYIYSEQVLDRESISLPTNLTNAQIVDRFIEPMIYNPETINLFYKKYDATQVDFSSSSLSYQWNQVTSGNASSSGYITRNSVITRVDDAASIPMDEIKVGSVVEFIETPYAVGTIGVPGSQLEITNGGTGYTSPPDVTIIGTGSGAMATASVNDGQVVSIIINNGGSGYENPVQVQITGGGGSGATASATASSAERVWARVVSISDSGLGVDDVSGNATGLDARGNGAIILNKVVPNTSRISRIFPSYNMKFTQLEKRNIIDQLVLNNNFGLRFDAPTNSWKVIRSDDIAPSSLNSPENFSLNFAGDTTSNNFDNSWIIRVDYSATRWTVLGRRFRIVFGSEDTVRFYNQNNRVSLNKEINKPQLDRVRILGVNKKPDNGIFPLGSDLSFFSFKYYTETDGYTDDHKLIVTIADADNDMFPDDPLAFDKLVGSDQIGIGQKEEDGYLYTVYSPEFPESNNGRSSLDFQWTRVSQSDQRIDPSRSNVMDVFVLTNSYDSTFRTWLNKDRKIQNIPYPPTSNELSSQFTSLSNKKGMSDTVIYRSARYKPLFGETADASLQAKFRVLKVQGTSVTDTDIKSRVLVAINEFFAVENWDFGETFYFTELAAYVHNQLLGIVSSIVIVPTQEDSVFGSLFQITPNTDELFIPDVTLSNIDIVSSLSNNNLRSRV